MIYNEYTNSDHDIETRMKRKKTVINNDDLMNIPPYTMFRNKQLVECNTRYIQRQ